ncbi:MAG: PrsW family intramembrane metalloprotease [Methanomicrobiaceae archaeon]|nr:PrsW family intramembrane metalloprotease [Methanomicrobiaceae archaeon]
MAEWMYILLLAVPPGLFWLWFFYRKDRFRPEPLRIVAGTFLLGMVAIIPAAAIEILFREFLTKAELAVLVAPPIEECVKMAAVLIFAYRHAAFDEPVDGIVYAVAAALGFATVEDALYISASFAESAAGGIAVAVLRGLLSMPGHALWAAIWGYALGLVRFADGKHAVRTVGLSLLLAIALHAQFNFLLLNDWWGFALVVLVAVPLTWALVSQRIERALMVE